MQLTLKLLTGKLVGLDVEPNDTILQIRHQIESKTGVPWAQQMLMCDGKPLRYNLTVTDYGLHMDSIIHMLIPCRCQKPIQVDLPNGLTISLRTNSHYSIGAIKHMLEKETDFPVEMQRLYYNNELLDDPESTLFENSVSSTNNLRLELKDE